MTALLAGVLPVATVETRPAAAATWSTPAFVQSMGGTGRAGVYAWGMDYNRVSNEIIVSDYLNFRVRRYSSTGTWLGDLPDQPGETFDVASDPNSGDIYVADYRKRKMHRYTKDGSYLGSWSTSGQRYAVWMDVDKNGDVWVMDSADYSTAGQVFVNRYTKDGVRTAQWPVTVPFAKIPTVFGIGVSNAGHVYLPDGNNRRIHVFSTSGAYVRSFGSDGSGLGGLSGDIRGMALDEVNRRLYVSDAGANQVESFSFDGAPLARWGGLDNSTNHIQAPRDLAVDAASNVWVADYGNHRFRRYSPTGVELGVYPQPSDAENDGHFGQVRDIDVDATTGDVWVVDTANQHFTRLASDGAFKGVWGRRGFGDYGTNYPSAIGFEPTFRRVWVASEEGRYIKVYDSDGTYRFIIGQQKKTPEDRGILQNPTDIDFRGNRAYVTDEQAKVIKVFDVADGTQVSEIQVRDQTLSTWSHDASAINPANGDLYVLNYKDDKIEVFSEQGVRKFTFGSRGSGDGQFQYPRDASIVDGVLYVTDSQLSRVQAFDLGGHFLGKWGGKGNGAYQFSQPTGLSTDSAGRLYITDMKANRVTVFDSRTARPAYEPVKPVLSLTTPVEGQVFAGSPVHVTGTVTDNAGIAAVEVSVQNTRTGQWFDGTIASWAEPQAWNLAPLVSSGRPATSATFDYAFPSVVHGDDYRVEVRARDAAFGSGNVSDVQARGFRLRAAGVGDAGAPDTTLVSPAAGASMPVGAVTARGTAADDVGVATVAIAVRRSGTEEYWQPGGGWGAEAWLPVTATPPGAPSVTWSVEWTPPAPGSYDIVVQATDVSGRIDETPAAATFVAQDDLVPPDGTVRSPARDASVPLGALTIQGNASDDVAVTAVFVSIRNNANQWWQPNGGWGSAVALLPADLAEPGAASSAWTYGWIPPAAGSYGLQVRTDDAAGRTDPTKPWVSFSVSSM